MRDIRRRLERLERNTQQTGTHEAMQDIAEHPDARVHVYSCSCGQVYCRQHPTLTLILRQYLAGEEPY